MLAFVSQADAYYACDAYNPITLQCSAWEVVSAPALLPVITTADANLIAVAMVQIFVFAWSFRFIGAVISQRC